MPFWSYFLLARFACSASMSLWLIPFMTLFVLDWQLFYCVVRMIYNPIEFTLENLSLSIECKCVQLIFQYYFHFIGQPTCTTIDDRRPNMATTMTFYWDTRIENELYANDRNGKKNWYKTASSSVNSFHESIKMRCCSLLLNVIHRRHHTIQKCHVCTDDH